jgi:hypothetical protein
MYMLFDSVHYLMADKPHRISRRTALSAWAAGLGTAGCLSDSESRPRQTTSPAQQVTNQVNVSGVVVKNPDDSFQGKLDEAREENALLYLSPGTHIFTSQLTADGGTVSIKASSASIIRNDVKNPPNGRQGGSFLINNCDRVFIDGGRWDFNGRNREPGALGEFHVIQSNDVTIQNLAIRDNRHFSIMIDGCTGVDVNNIDIHSFIDEGGVDGVHLGTFQGPVENVRISGITGTTGDDSVALVPRKHDIRNVSISNCNVESLEAAGLKLAVAKAAESADAAVENVTVDNYHIRSNDFRDGLEVRDVGPSPIDEHNVKNIVLNATIHNAKTTGARIQQVDGIQANLLVTNAGADSVLMDNTANFDIDVISADSGKQILRAVECTSGSLSVRGTAPEGNDAATLTNVSDFSLSANLTGRGGGNGVTVKNSSRGIITGSRITGFDAGITAENSSQLLVSNNHLVGNNSPLAVPDQDNQVDANLL